MATTEKETKLPELRKMEGIWENVFSYHPFEPVLDRAEGIYLYDEEGNRYIDASGGPMAVNLGHGDPRMKEAVARQMDKFSFCHPALSCRERAELCTAVSEVAPGDLNATYLVSGGSEAVETAIKLARQYHIATGNPNKYKVITHRDSYHGMTLAALGMSGNPGSQRLFEPMIPQWPHIPQYSDYNRPQGTSRDDWAVTCAQELELAIHYTGKHTVSAFMATPHGCGSDYGVVPPKKYWECIREICDRYNVLLIADEVITGFGRTGKWFGMEHFAVQADIMTTGKGISGLYIPLGAVTVSDKVNAPFKEGTGFIHGFTNAGHPVACAAGLQAIDIIKKDRLVENSAEVGEHLHSYRDRLLAHPTVVDVRGWGIFMVTELVKDKETMEFFDREEQAENRLQAMALRNGLVFYGTLYGGPREPAFRRGLPNWISPPICITREQVDELIDAYDRTLTEWEESLGVS